MDTKKTKQGKYYIQDPVTGKIRGKPIGDKPMSTKVIGVRLPLEDDEFVRSLPFNKRSAFLRDAIARAIDEYKSKKTA